ncbi:hypothetical protein GF325_12505 [Candidatus Bathyarchaeota archaeon]|nr:hypothetical protein [Candidatus Bathyarchaeota archaeon]
MGKNIIQTGLAFLIARGMYMTGSHAWHVNMAGRYSLEWIVRGFLKWAPREKRGKAGS